ncbi:type VI secretion system baseplate subunit TssG [Spirosoma spitsbergense]|uniref:type VI secretion system baseplate subunit TssG n=1 Tax=Spirosoma spitsbergense TaxID=431554 RepID=UPI000365090A|nr:type VI secretion system baseplate subunit TssG [Spirosoma spitsbergense]
MTLDEYSREIDGLTKAVDIRLEIILAELYGRGLDPREDVLIHPAGLFSRSYRRDVGRVNVGPSDSLEKSDDEITEPQNISLPPEDQRDFLNIEVHRDGLYDYLPEGLFHQPTTPGRDQQEVFADFDEQARRVRAARRFFQPFEQEFYFQRLFMELEARKYQLTEENLRTYGGGESLREFWGIPADLLNTRQLVNLLHMLPIAHRISNDDQLIISSLELILDVPIVMRTISPLTFEITLAAGDSPAPNELCRTELGNFSLGGIYQDTMPAIELRIGPLNSSQLIDFLAGGRSRKILDLLIGYFLPTESDVIEYLLTTEDDQFLILSDDQPTSVLGWASYI